MRLDLFMRLETLDYLIYSRSTGTPEKLAKRLSISVRTLYEFLEVMKDLGAPICYCKKSKTYFYSEKGSISVRFKKTSNAA